MILIHNISKGAPEESTYRVQINRKVICEFKHKRSEGLAQCLRLAADAVEKEREQFINKVIKEYHEGTNKAKDV